MSSHLIKFSPDQIEQLDAKRNRLESDLCQLERRHRRTELAIANVRAQHQAGRFGVRPHAL